MKSKNKFWNVLVILITPLYLIIISISNLIYKIQIPQYMTLFCAWILYYYIGLIFNVYRENIEIRIDKITLYIAITLFIIIFSSLNIIMYNRGVEYNYVISQVKLQNVIYIILCVILIKKNEGQLKDNNLLIELGNYSFGIYFVHTYAIKIYYNIISSNYFIELIIGVIMVTAISYYSIKIFKYITKNKFDKILGF